MTRIMHISDNHSVFLPLIGEFDVIVHSGDMLPNQTRGNRLIEPNFQKSWVITHLDEFAAWIGDKPLIMCCGNHDFYNPIAVLRTAGINAFDATNKTVEFNGLKFYGFPYIPYIGGEWNYELLPQQMVNEVDKLVAHLNDGLVDVLVAHSPIFGILDRRWDNQHCGNTAMKNAFEYKVNVWPKAYLHGHIHDEPGITQMETMIISNAATTTRIIEIL